MAEFRMTVDIRLPAETAEIVYRALKPETRQAGRDRTRLGLERHAGGIRLDMAATDLVAARALANSFIRLLDVSISAYGVARHG
ncbi:hypothetical protein HRbin01_01500 [archaeon HR01]|nr:hypothetical protein HRbin01_01500 [archaeon HR01]